MPRRKLPRHAHLPDEILSSRQLLGLDAIPQIDWARMAFDTWDALYQGLVGTALWTTEQLNSLLTNLSKTATEFFAWISDRTNWLWNDISGTFAEWKSAITDTINWAWSEFEHTCAQVAGLLSGINSTGKLILTQIGTKVADLATVWTKATKIAWADVIHLAQDILTSLGSITYAQINNLLTSWSKLTNASALGLIDFTTYISNRAFSAMSGSITWAQNCFSTLTQFLAQIPISAIATTGNLATDALSALNQMKTGFFTGTTGLLKFATGFFTGANGRAKFSDDLALPFTKLEAIPYKLPTSAHNIITNPSYEGGLWGGDETLSSYNPKFGKQYMTLTASGSNIEGGYSNFIDIRGLINFTISMWLAGNVTTGNFFAFIFFYKADKTPCADEHAIIVEISSEQPAWTQQSHTFVVSSDLPADCKFVRVRCNWWNVAGNPVGEMSVDGWQFNYGDQIPAFQDFTTYSYNWMPEKIETANAGDVANSDGNWTDLLELPFNCEATMLCLIFAHCHFSLLSGYELNWQVTINDETIEGVFKLLLTGTYIEQGVHFVKILEKGDYVLKLQFRRIAGAGTAYAALRRLTVLKGFYQGGTN